jgi:hypothetical protein
MVFHFECPDIARNSSFNKHQATNNGVTAPAILLAWVMGRLYHVAAECLTTDDGRQTLEAGSWTLDDRVARQTTDDKLLGRAHGQGRWL